MTTLHNMTFDYTQMAIDAGGRVRTSQMTTLLDMKQLEYEDTLLWSRSSTGTVTGVWADNMFTMQVYGGTSEYRYSSLSYAPYFSGKVQDVEQTVDNFAPQSGVSKQVGYFSFNPPSNAVDGFWLNSSSGTISIQAYRNGVITLDRPMNQWFGYGELAEYQNTTTWDNFTVFFFDFLWLGGAILRLWVKTSNGFVMADIFHYSGVTKDTFVRFPTQPIQYRIKSSGGNGQVRVICSQVATEGSVDESGRSVVVDNGSTAVGCNSIGTTYPVLLIRKNPAYKHQAIQLNSISSFVKSNLDQMRYSLQINPTLSSPVTWINHPSVRGIQYAVGNGTITVTAEGHVLLSDYISYGEPIDNTPLEQNYYAWLGISGDDVPQVYAMCATPITANVDVFCTIGAKVF